MTRFAFFTASLGTTPFFSLFLAYFTSHQTPFILDSGELRGLRGVGHGACRGLGENVKNPSSQGSIMATEQTILVGKKPTTNYVIATVMAFNAGVKKVVLKARGAAISKAVSTAVMVRDRFLPGKVQIRDVKLLSDKVQGQAGRERTVAAVEIVVEMA
jgi:DNA-binding protein